VCEVGKFSVCASGDAGIIEIRKWIGTKSAFRRYKIGEAMASSSCSQIAQIPSRADLRRRICLLSELNRYSCLQGNYNPALASWKNPAFCLSPGIICSQSRRSRRAGWLLSTEMAAGRGWDVHYASEMKLPLDPPVREGVTHHALPVLPLSFE